jgi:hypothetical protein
MLINPCVKMGGCRLENLTVKMLYRGLSELTVGMPDKLRRVHTILPVKAF